MTPNQPSGMTPKSPEPRQGLFGRIWARWQRIQRPAPATPYSPGLPALVDPFLATEAVSDAQRPVTQAQNIRTREVMGRICATNNANVTRDYGTHTEDLTHVGMVPPDLSGDELADAKRLLDVHVAAEEPANPYTTLHEGATPERIT